MGRPGFLPTALAFFFSGVASLKCQGRPGPSSCLPANSKQQGDGVWRWAGLGGAASLESQECCPFSAGVAGTKAEGGGEGWRDLKSKRHLLLELDRIHSILSLT